MYYRHRSQLFSFTLALAPRLRPEADFSEMNELLHFNQLAEDFESGCFSTTPLQPPIPTAIAKEPLVITPYRSPAWLASFLLDLLASQNNPLLGQTARIVNEGHCEVGPDLVSELRAPHSAKEYLSAHYSAEFQILRHVALDSERYGAACLHYTRYRILSRIAGTLGLHLSKPSQPSTIQGLTFTYNDLIQWAEVNSGTFGNLKTLLACTDNLRARLNRSASATTDLLKSYDLDDCRFASKVVDL
ncbi:hypothetical protein DFH08DRAFT_813206 [Mycena albidolilacea]|uniref:Uncharacterized protein n=1 Tax=Mycena albidolilacea TaxID=1033008 RepID=A0AAD7ELZ3_9AGAR|nr:hypothetical protein DFH08DRAFT_813206 [Mycena albidolilacea]